MILRQAKLTIKMSILRINTTDATHKPECLNKNAPYRRCKVQTSISCFPDLSYFEYLYVYNNTAMLYVFFWVIPWIWILHADISQHCLFWLHRQVGMKNDWVWEYVPTCGLQVGCYPPQPLGSVGSRTRLSLRCNFSDYVLRNNMFQPMVANFRLSWEYLRATVSYITCIM